MLSLEKKKRISLIYQEKINNIFPRYKNKDKIYEPYERVVVSIIHNNKDLNFNCSDREILYALKECLGEYWQFRENNWGKSLQCNFEFISPDPKFNNIFQIYKKFYMQRMELIFEQYDKKFKTQNIESKFKLDYDKIKNRVQELKKINNKCTKFIINKLPNLNEDIYNLIYDYSKEYFDIYFELRNELENIRRMIKGYDY